MEMTIEQQRAIAVAKARARAAAGAQGAQQPDPSAPPASKGDFQGFAPGVVQHGQTPDNQLIQEEVGRPNALESALFGAADMGTFGTVDEMSAGLSSLLDGKNYDQALQHARDRMKAAQKAHPIANVVGSVAGVVPMAMNGIGAVREGVGLGGKMLAGSLAGGAMGAAHGFGSGEGGAVGRAFNAANETLIGALLGGAIPAVGAGVGKVAQALRGGRVAGGKSASSIVGRAFRDDMLTPESAMARLNELGPDAVISDLGPNLQRQAGALASIPGKAQQVVRDALMKRAQGANGRIVSDVDATLGPAPVPSRVDAGIVANQRGLGPEYDQVLAGASAVDTAPIAEGLDAGAVNLRGAAQSAVQKIRKMLNVTGAVDRNGNPVLDPNPRTLLETRKAIDGMLATEADPNAINALTSARAQIDDVLAQAVPGLKEVDAKFAELAKQREALAQGANVLDSGKTAMRPSELVDQVLQAGDPRLVGPSGVPFRLSQGARAEIDRLIGTNVNDVSALRQLVKGEGSWNRDRLATLFGPDKADALLRILEREKTFADTGKIVMSNSETAARLSAQKEVGGAGAAMDKPAGFFRSLFNVKPGDAAAAAIDKVTAGMSAAKKALINEEMARILATPMTAAQRTEKVGALVRALAASKAGQSAEAITTGVLTPIARVVPPTLLNYANNRSLSQ